VPYRVPAAPARSCSRPPRRLAPATAAAWAKPNTGFWPCHVHARAARHHSNLNTPPPLNVRLPPCHGYASCCAGALTTKPYAFRALIAIYGPIIYTAPLMMRANPLRGQVGGPCQWSIGSFMYMSSRVQCSKFFLPHCPPHISTPPWTVASAENLLETFLITAYLKLC
jgi:hypothetical protein